MKNILLKEKLLSLNIVEDNEYLNKYCELIELNKESEAMCCKTQGHHYIPVCYYKEKYNLKTREEAEKYADDDKNNFKVNLLYRDHALAHYYLAMCAKSDSFITDMTYAFNFIVYGKMCLKSVSDFTPDEQTLSNLQNLYVCSKIYFYNKIKDLFNGRVALYKDNEQIYVCPDEVDEKLCQGYHKGIMSSTREKIRKTVSQKIWITNGVEELSVNEFDDIPDGYYRSRITNYFQDRKTLDSEKRRRDNLSKAHRGMKLSEETKQKLSYINLYGEKRTSLRKWMNNGEINTRVLQSEISKYIEEGWRLGKIGKNKPCSKSRKKKIGVANKGKKFIYKNDIVKSVKKENLDLYLNDGWQLGNPNLSKTKRGVK